MAKPRKPQRAQRLDFAQSALASLLKATGAKRLVEPKVVKMPRAKKR